MPRVKRHLAGLTELQSQGKRILAAIQTRFVAAIITLDTTLIATSVQSNTVPSFFERRCALFSEIPIAAYTTTHLEASAATSTAAAIVSMSVAGTFQS